MDGFCLINVDLVWGEHVSVSSERMIGKAAVTILQWCVGLEGHPNTGGVAQNIGTYPHRRAPTD